LKVSKTPRSANSPAETIRTGVATVRIDSGAIIEGMTAKSTTERTTVVTGGDLIELFVSPVDRFTNNYFPTRIKTVSAYFNSLVQFRSAC
jgi:hypothetical protein